MKKIKLSNCADHALVDDDIYEEVNKWKWYKRKNGYAARGENIVRDGKNTCLIHFLHHAVLPREPGMVVDHVNRNKLDNRRANLRKADYSSNIVNRIPKKVNVHGYRGISMQRNGRTWSFTLRKNGIAYYEGGFPSKESAALAYNEAAKKLHGEYAVLNTISKAGMIP